MNRQYHSPQLSTIMSVQQLIWASGWWQIDRQTGRGRNQIADVREIFLLNSSKIPVPTYLPSIMARVSLLFIAIGFVRWYEREMGSRERSNWGSWRGTSLWLTILLIFTVLQQKALLIRAGCPFPTPFPYINALLNYDVLFLLLRILRQLN